MDTSRAAALRFLSAMPLNFLRNPSRVRPAAATATLLVFAISLDAFGFLLVSRVPNFTLDTLMYLHMAQYGPGSVPAPYSFRVLVPFIAAHMHVPVAIGLKIIAGISLALSLWFAGLCAIRTGASTKGAAAGILVLFCSRTVLYQFHNPYLTDAPGLMILMAMMLVSLDSHAGIFGVLGASGLLVRESMVFMVPSMLFSRQWKRGIAVCAMCAAVFLGPRFLLGSTYSRYLHSGGMIQYNLGHPLRWAALVTLSWYMAWPLLPIGLALMPRKHVAAVAGTTLTLGLGCIASCMMAGLWNGCALSWRRSWVLVPLTFSTGCFVGNKDWLWLPSRSGWENCSRCASMLGIPEPTWWRHWPSACRLSFCSHMQYGVYGPRQGQG